MSGWTTLTVKAHSPEDAEALRDAVAVVCENQRDARVVGDDCRVEALDWGYGDSMTPVLKDHADLWSDAIVMVCNDTSDSGNGRYLTSDGIERSVETVRRAHGAESARGHDAAAELKGFAGFQPYMR